LTFNGSPGFDLIISFLPMKDQAKILQSCRVNRLKVN